MIAMATALRCVCSCFIKLFGEKFVKFLMLFLALLVLQCDFSKKDDEGVEPENKNPNDAKEEVVEIPDKLAIGRVFSIKVDKPEHDGKGYTLSLHKCASPDIVLLSGDSADDQLVGKVSGQSIKLVIVDKSNTEELEPDKVANCELSLAIKDGNDVIETITRPLAFDASKPPLFVVAEVEVLDGAGLRVELAFAAGALQEQKQLSYRHCSAANQECEAWQSLDIAIGDDDTSATINITAAQQQQQEYLSHVRIGAVVASFIWSGQTQQRDPSLTLSQAQIELGKSFAINVAASEHANQPFEAKLTGCASHDLLLLDKFPTGAGETWPWKNSSDYNKLAGKVGTPLTAHVYHTGGKRAPSAAEVAGCKLSVVITTATPPSPLLEAPLSFNLTAKTTIGISWYRVIQKSGANDTLRVELSFEKEALSGAKRIFYRCCLTEGNFGCLLTSNTENLPPQQDATTFVFETGVVLSPITYCRVTAMGKNFSKIIKVVR